MAGEGLAVRASPQTLAAGQRMTGPAQVVLSVLPVVVPSYRTVHSQLDEVEGSQL